MKNFGRFGPLLGVINVTNTHCKFLVYAAQNAEVLTCHEIKLNVQTRDKPGWLEFDPMELNEFVYECIEYGIKNLLFLEINPDDIVSIGVTNQRCTTILWNKYTGAPLYNAIAWNDTRTCETVDKILSRIKNKKNYLKSVCGLTISPPFSAMKIIWLLEHCVEQDFDASEYLFGTLDTWIIWNLTGGIECGVHVTDVTNASHTMLMNLVDLNWDKNLCKFLNIPMIMLPTIKSCSEVYGYIESGSLNGVPIAGCIGDQQAALLGQMCLNAGEVVCTYDENCSVIFNAGQEIINSNNGLLSTVAFQLGPKANVYYALEGIIGSTGTSITWLKDNLNTTIDLKLLAVSNEANDVVFVPSFSGLCSPHWNHNSRGIILGLNSSSKTSDIVLAAYESACFQIYDILNALKKDCRNWPKIDRLLIGGECSDKFLQLLADLSGIEIERPQTSNPSCLGAMMAAGLAMNVLTLDNNRIMTCHLYTPPSDFFNPVICDNQREIRYGKWRKTINEHLLIENSVNNNNNNNYSNDNIKSNSMSIWHSIPGSIFIFTAFAYLTAASYFNPDNIINNASLT